MEDTRVTLMALGLLVVVLTILVGTIVLTPSTTVLLVTLAAWTNLTYLVAITLKR